MHCVMLCQWVVFSYTIIILKRKLQYYLNEMKKESGIYWIFLIYLLFCVCRGQSTVVMWWCSFGNVFLPFTIKQRSRLSIMMFCIIISN